METVRAFAGLLLDIGATRRVAEYTRNLRRAATGAGWQCAWTPPPNLHITLRFLGEVDAGLVGPLGDAVAAVAARVEPVTLTLGALECFPHRDNPRVLCVAVGRGSELLQRARQQLDGALAELGIPAEGRPYRAPRHPRAGEGPGGRWDAPAERRRRAHRAPARSHLVAQRSHPRRRRAPRPAAHARWGPRRGGSDRVCPGMGVRGLYGRSVRVHR
jgi:2'-5' RNA ligase